MDRAGVVHEEDLAMFGDPAAPGAEGDMGKS
jgi:hypothetical protein